MNVNASVIHPITPAFSKGLLWLIALIVSLPITATDIYLPSLPSLQADLGTTEALAELTFSVYFIGLAVTQLIYGPLCDRFGRKPILLVGIAIYCLGSILSAMALSIEWFMTGRIIQAIGAGSGTVIGFTLVQDMLGDRSARVNSQIIAIVSLSPIIAPVIGGQIEAFFNWRMCFFLLAGLSLAALLLTLWFLPETRLHTQPRANMFKSVWKILKNSHFRHYTLVCSFHFACLFCFVTVAPTLFIEHFGYSASAFSGLFAVAALGYILGARLCTQYVRIWGEARVCLIGNRLILGGGATMLLTTLLFPQANLLVVLSMLVVEMGISTSLSAGMVLAIKSVREQTGTAMALMQFVRLFTSGLASTLIVLFPNHSALTLSCFLCGLGLLGAYHLKASKLA